MMSDQVRGGSSKFTTDVINRIKYPNIRLSRITSAGSKRSVAATATKIHAFFCTDLSKRKVEKSTLSELLLNTLRTVITHPPNIRSRLNQQVLGSCVTRVQQPGGGESKHTSTSYDPGAYFVLHAVVRVVAVVPG